MARVKRGVTAHRRHKRLLKSAEMPLNEGQLVPNILIAWLQNSCLLKKRHSGFEILMALCFFNDPECLA